MRRRYDEPTTPAGWIMDLREGSMMPWVPSHSSLARHPKLRRLSRLLQISEPAAIGHLHLLWWWALEIAPDGDLSRYDHADIAEGAEWPGSSDAFVQALIDCGPGDASGFLEASMILHDWQEYGGRYEARVEAGRKAAQARWHSEGDADAMRSHSDGNPEERRGEEKRREKKRKTSMRSEWIPDEGNVSRLKEKFPKIDVDAEIEKFRDHFISKGETRADWNAGLRTWIRNAETYRQRREGEKPGGWR
jgi:hypothetical protein